MSRFWLIVGMVISLLVPVGYIASVAAGAWSEGPTGSTETTARVSPDTGENGQTFQDAMDAIVVEKSTEKLGRLIDQLRPIVEGDSFGPAPQRRARVIGDKSAAIAADLKGRNGARELRAVALRLDAAADAWARYAKNPTESTYAAWEKARKAFNRAMRAATE